MSCFRQLAGNVASTVQVGQPVIVQGRLRIKEWEAEGQRRTTVEIEASSIGLDLVYGTASFSRNVSARSQGRSAQDAAPGTDGAGSWPDPGGEPGTRQESGCWGADRPQADGAESREETEPYGAGTSSEGDGSGMTEASAEDEALVAMS